MYAVRELSVRNFHLGLLCDRSYGVWNVEITIVRWRFFLPILGL